MAETTSRLPGFYEKSLRARADTIAAWADLSEESRAALGEPSGLGILQADNMIENVVGTHSLPLGVAVNFQINGREVLVPMAIEEPSVVAGASLVAKLARERGGFCATASESEMIGQIQILDLDNVDSAKLALSEAKTRIIKLANKIDPVIVGLGGGARDLEVRVIKNSPIGPFLVAHLIYDTRDAMGANAINTATETLAPVVEEITGGRVHFRILSNLADRRLAKACATFSPEILAFGEYTGEQVRDGIIEGWAFAESDPYRAATHNKGIMNGVDAVVIATGNDWRAIEAAAHAYAARSGRYSSLSKWEKDTNGNLVGYLEMPMAVGTVGGATNVHPTAQASLQILRVNSSAELAEIVVSVGLAQNLAALRALATEGIQRGHMRLHARQVATASGAIGEEIDRVTHLLIHDRVVRIDRAEEILAKIRET